MKIKTEAFEGPLDLLLSMIEEERLDITEISLAKIADQYIEYVERNTIDPEEVANFLVIAARLLLIKSKTLLPYLIQDEEEDEIKDFAQQLKIYKDFLDASTEVEKLLSQGKFLRSRNEIQLKVVDEGIFYPASNVSIGVLESVFTESIERIRPEEILEEDTIAKSVSIDQRIDLIKESLQKLKTLSFNSLVKKDDSKIDIIINFIAMLELIKQQTISTKQVALFSDITLTRI